MKAKLLFTIILTFVFVFALTLICSAKEITVGAEGCDHTSVTSANNAASDGDTVIIKTDISGGTITFAKSLTYILEADWTNVGSSGASADTAGKTISIYARGGNRTIKFSGTTLFNSYNSTYTQGTVLNFGGEDDYTLTLNVSGVTRRFLYGFTGATVNFYKGTIYTGSQRTAWDGGDTNIDCGTFNMYDGAEIYGNKDIGRSSVHGLISASQQVNIYGGKIYGNVLASCGYAMIRCTGDFNMYGGEIYDNFLTFASSAGDHGPGLINAITQNIYGGTIHNNYIQKGNSQYGGTVFGSRTYTNKADSYAPCHAYLIDGSVYENYSYTYNSGASVTNDNFSTYFSTEANGAYKLKDASFFTVVEGFRRTSKNNETLFDHSVILLSSDGKSAVEAIMLDESGNLVKALSGATEAAIPSNHTWSTKANYCLAVSASMDSQATYYVAAAHTYAQNDFDCTTGDTCSVCLTEIEGLTHVTVEAIVYENGYYEKGLYTRMCTNDGCHACDEEADTDAIFASLGYSASERETGFFSVTQGFSVNKDALNAYNSLSETDIVDFGVVAGAKAVLGDTTEVFENGAPSGITGVIFQSMLDYSYFEIKITGLEAEADGVAHESLDLYCCAYYIEGKDSFYMDENGITDTLTHSVSYSSLCPIAQ